MATNLTAAQAKKWENLLLNFAKNFCKENYGVEFNIPLRLNGTMKRALGWFKHYGGWNKPECIELSRDLIKNFNEDMIIKVLKHELIHYCLYTLKLDYKDGQMRFENEIVKHNSVSSGSHEIEKGRVVKNSFEPSQEFIELVKKNKKETKTNKKETETNKQETPETDKQINNTNKQIVVNVNGEEYYFESQTEAAKWFADKFTTTLNSAKWYINKMLKGLYSAKRGKLVGVRVYAK